MSNLEPLPGAYSSGAFDVLAPDIEKVTDYVMELEQLTKAIPVVRAELKNLRDVAPASNADVLRALTECVGQPADDANSTDRRIEALRPIVRHVSDAFRNGAVGRRHRQDAVAPALRSLYVTAAVDQLTKDFEKLKIEDRSIAHNAKIRDAEVQLKKLEQKLADHSAFCLSCFKDNRLPHTFRGQPRSALIAAFGLAASATDIEIGLKILEDFLKTWKSVASVLPEPCSPHGVAISSMPPEKRKVWSRAFIRAGLKSADPKQTTVFHPRVEPRSSASDHGYKARVWQRA